MPEGVTNSEPITFEMPPLSESQVEAFRRATRSEHSSGVPLTFATIFRKAEFEWADRLQVKVQSVLHAEQEYQYVQPLRVGERPIITTALKSARARSGMIFLSLESEVRCDGELKILSTTIFVVREAKETA